MSAETHDGFLRIRQVLELVPISRSSWWLGVKQGRYPAPIKLSSNVTVWRKRDVLELCARIERGEQPRAAA